MPNMDEVVRQKDAEIERLRGICKYAENEYNGLHERFIASEEHVRLLIEERESHGPEGRNYTNAQYVTLLQERERFKEENISLLASGAIDANDNVMLRSKVAEQDKEIQRLQKLEDVMKLFKLNGATDIFYWL
jgi:hypothetical protein